jgi:RNA polymerase sigma factor (sigma-70 family)
MHSVHHLNGKGREPFGCAQAGCQECVNELLQQHRKLVVAVVRRQWKGERATFADLVQEGNIALWRAIMGFDPGRGLAFSTYAWRAIERAVWQAVARAERPEGCLPLPESEEPSAVVALQYDAAVVKQAVAKAVERLPSRLASIVTTLYGLNGQPAQSLRSAGAQYELSAERIRQLRNDALLQLRLPAYSGRLRQLCDQSDRVSYERMQQMNRDWLHRRRGRQP